MSNQLLLQRIVRTLSPPRETGLMGAFAYGSVAFPQHGRPRSDSQLDLIFIVRDPERWHVQNASRYPTHYSFLMRHNPRFFVRTILSRFPGPQIFYNPFIPWFDECEGKQLRLKYGVVGHAKVEQDLQSWSSLYLAGRLHKPVLWIPLGDEQSPSDSDRNLNKLVSNNLLAALSYVLLQVDPSRPFLTEFELFRAITSISYDGDWRMLVGEDKNKVDRIVTGQERLSRFQSLYSTTLAHPSLSKYVGLLPTDTTSLANEVHFSQPPDSKDVVVSLLNNIPTNVCRRALPGRRFWNCDPREVLAELSAVERQLRLRRTVRRIVMLSSVQQTVFSICTTGPVRSALYAKEKLRKMLASLGLLNW
ncbi:MMP37-like protein mitochondrial [Clonorchis sinensis]|uniref:Phosphatidate cytidylyltransferase, mitochondrial n=1 Tax=Clonorchis sinensis TaxID=79923 RepID=H2KNU2_CLOSI|nr:MMP37-like protein mitochondrial [Clonorchis sinensis]